MNMSSTRSPKLTPPPAGFSRSASTGDFPRLPASARSFSRGAADFRKSWFYRNNRCRAQRLWRQDKGHRAELEAFVRAVKSNGGPPVSFDSLYATTLATFRIRESLARGAELPVFPPEENGGK